MFTKAMSLLEALRMHPRALEVFEKHGMSCAQCLGAAEETVENGARMHGVKLEALMKDLNELLAAGK